MAVGSVEVANGRARTVLPISRSRCRETTADRGTESAGIGGLSTVRRERGQEHQHHDGQRGTRTATGKPCWRRRRRDGQRRSPHQAGDQIAEPGWAAGAFRRGASARTSTTAGVQSGVRAARAQRAAEAEDAQDDCGGADGQPYPKVVPSSDHQREREQQQWPAREKGVVLWAPGEQLESSRPRGAAGPADQGSRNRSRRSLNTSKANGEPYCWRGPRAGTTTEIRPAH